MNKKKILNQFKVEYKASRNMLEPLISRRKRNLDLYTGFFAESKLENADQIKENVPYTKTLLDNTFPMLVSKLPQSKVSPRNAAKYYAPAKLMNSLINYTFDSNSYQLKFLMNTKEAMLFGDHFTKVIWNPDPKKNYPLLTSIDSNNISVHPAKLELDDEYPLFLRREMTKRQMKEETNWDKDAIDSLGESKLNDKSYRKEQMTKLGLAPDVRKGEREEEEWNLYEVVERWGMMDFKNGERKMSCVVIANGDTILNPDPFGDGLEPFESPFANNVMPFAQLSYDPLPNSFFSMSFIDPIANMQVELNDLEAMKKSNYIRRNNPPIIVDKNAEVDLSSLKFMAGLPWLVNGVTNIQPFVLPDLAQSIELQQTLIRRTMQNVTGAQDQLMAVPEMGSQGTHKVQSAAHAQMLQESIKIRFQPQAVLIDKYIERIGKLLINLWQDKRYWVGMEGSKVALAIADEEGNNSITEVTFKDIQGELDFVVTSASSIAKSPQVIATTAANLLQMFAADQTLDLTPLKRELFENSGFDFNQIQKPKASFMPQMQQKLQQLIAITQDPKFKTAPKADQLKIMQQIQVIKQQIQQLQGQQQGGQPTPQGPESTASGQQLQPQQAQG